MSDSRQTPTGKAPVETPDDDVPAAPTAAEPAESGRSEPDPSDSKASNRPAKAPPAPNPEAAGDGTPAAVPLPWSIKAAMAAAIGYVVFGLARALAMLGSTDKLKAWLVYLNDHAGKKKIADFDSNPSKIADALHSQRVGSLQVAIVVGIAVLILTFMLRRPKQATIARWALLVLLVITLPMTNGPFAIIPQHHLPATVAVPWVLTGFAWIAIVVLLFMPTSSAYFRACKRATAPAGATARRPGLRDLFMPRGTAPAGSASSRASTARAGSSGSDDTSQSPPAGRDPSGRARAKVRADEAAIAKGADLARSRAKASKSRRPDG